MKVAQKGTMLPSYSMTVVLRHRRVETRCPVAIEYVAASVGGGSRRAAMGTTATGDSDGVTAKLVQSRREPDNHPKNSRRTVWVAGRYFVTHVFSFRKSLSPYRVNMTSELSGRRENNSRSQRRI